MRSSKTAIVWSLVLVLVFLGAMALSFRDTMSVTRSAGSKTIPSISHLFSGLNSQWPRTVTPLETSVESLRLGISVEEAHSIIGEPPTQVSQQAGILASPVMMFTPTEEHIAKYGAPKNYSMHVWKHDRVNAVVIADEEGKVVGRWTWHGDE